MNREQRRKAAKSGDPMTSPCTLVEAVQIARAAAEDVIAEYQMSTRHLQVSLSLQVEILKEIVMEKGLITEEEFREKYMQKVEDFNKRQAEAMKAAESDSESPTGDAKMDINADMSVEKE